MKLSSKILTIALAMMTCFSCSTENGQLVIENSVFAKIFHYNLTKAGPILIEVRSKNAGGSITRSNDTPYFEFVINNKLVGSNDKLWRFRSSTTRSMGNGGTEHNIIFEGVKDPVAGLQIQLLQQTFPESTLMREKLILKAESTSYTLNKLDNHLHFRFPAYALSNPDNNSVEATEIRIASFEKKPITFGDKNKGNHMYYPDLIQHDITEKTATVKGPISIITNGEWSWFTAYEHASQDDLNGLLKSAVSQGDGILVNDAMQGVKGVFDFAVSEDDFKFLGISTRLAHEQIDVGIEILRGGYLDGEVIDAQHPYATVWTATGYYQGNQLEDGKSMLRNYLLNQICEKPASRVPEFYYNTWGLQRNDPSQPLRDILTYERILEEIDYAAELGVDIFVLDDGWENAQGDWFPNEKRLPEGLAPIKNKLDDLGMKMGLWYSPMGIDSSTQRFKQYPEWVIKDSEGNPILAQWDHPAFDFVSDFFDLFIQDCKAMIDVGCRFMKWDAINTFYSNLPDLHHGSAAYSEEELRARYEYLLPIYVVRAMEVLTDYEPDLIIEIDLTEARRVMTGLAPLSQGKLFWMNNGASWYNDYTAYRTQSMRTIANEFAGLIPLELFTYANYPHNLAGKMEYNVHNSLLAGHGFWGNLRLLKPEERKWIGAQVAQSKRVLPYLINVNPIVTGSVGDSPEIYQIVNQEEAAGQVIVFTTKPVKKEVEIDIKSDNMLVALNNPYAINRDQLFIPFELSEKQSSLAVVIIPNLGSDLSISSSTSIITDVAVGDRELVYEVANAGKQTISVGRSVGRPKVTGSEYISAAIQVNDLSYELTVETKTTPCVVSIQFD